MIRYKQFIASSLVLNILLVGLFFTHYPSSFYSRFITKTDAEIKYSLERFSFHYLPEPNDPRIAIIGDSRVRGADLSTLLQRNDVINRGISSDRSIWMQERIKFLLWKKPKFLVIQGGINDINGRIPIDSIFKSKIFMVNFCKENEITPILMEVIPVTKNPELKISASSQEINKSVSDLNTMLEEYSIKNSIAYVHVTKDLTVNNTLKTELSRDGIHLNKEGYAIFAKNIREVLAKLGA